MTPGIGQDDKDRSATTPEADFHNLSFRGGHHDFDQAARVGELRLDAGAHRHVLRIAPGGPNLVHRRAVTDVGDPDGGGEDLRLVRPALGEQPVDFVQYFLGLPFHVGVQVLGDDTGQIYGLAVLDGQGKDAVRLVTHEID